MPQIAEFVHYSNSIMNTAKRHIPAENAPGWLWTTAAIGATIVVFAALIGALAVARRAADPPRAVREVWRAGDWSWAGGPARALAPGAEAWAAAPSRLPDGRFTLDVRAHLDANADPGAAWGVWIAAAGGGRIVYTLSGEGYLTTRRCPPGKLPPALEDCPALRPEWRWTAYPRLHPPGATNRLELYRETPGAIRLWINRERLGLAAVDPAGEWGVWWRGGRSAGSELTWESAAIYEG